MVDYIRSDQASPLIIILFGISSIQNVGETRQRFGSGTMTADDCLFLIGQYATSTGGKWRLVLMPTLMYIGRVETDNLSGNIEPTAYYVMEKWTLDCEVVRLITVLKMTAQIFTSDRSIFCFRY